MSTDGSNNIWKKLIVFVLALMAKFAPKDDKKE